MARLERCVATVRRPVIVEIGAGTAIPTVRSFSEQPGPGVIRIIHSITPSVRVTASVIAGNALHVLKQLDRMLKR